MGHIKIQTVLIEVCHTLYLRRMMVCQVAHTQILAPPPTPNIKYREYLNVGHSILHVLIQNLNLC